MSHKTGVGYELQSSILSSEEAELVTIFSLKMNKAKFSKEEYGVLLIFSDIKSTNWLLPI